MENNTNQLNPMLCKRNCGFFGNAACDGYCSKCYKDHVKRQNSGSAAGRVTPTGLTASQVSSTSLISNQQSQVSEIPVSQEADKAQITVTENNTDSFTPPLPVIQTQTSIPIPIPSRSTTTSDSNNNVDSIAMSVPGEFLSSSLLSTSTSPMGAESIENSTSLASSISAGTSVGSEKKKRTRCVLESCKRKVGLTGFDCRCGGLYCWEHRYSDKHNCKFDYKELGQDQIRKNNPIVIGEKIQKI